MTGMAPVVGLHRLVRERGTVRATFPHFKPDHEGLIWACAGCPWKFSYDVDRLRATEAWHQDPRHKPPAPAVAPDSPSPVVVDPPAISGPQNGAEHEETVADGRVSVWFVPHIADPAAPTVAELNAGIKWTDLFGIDPYCEPSVADRLRTLADADLEAAEHGSRIQRAAAKAAARAYRLAADMIEEEA